MKYFPEKIEEKWQKRWLKEKVYEPNFLRAKKPFYNLMMFPYPSAEGLHIGGMRTFTGVDIYGRLKRMQGCDVFEPMGLDGFGIHSENYALKVGKHPMQHAKDSEKNFYRQLAAMGNGFAWEERLETYDPEYYRWTQWIFLQMYKNGLAYRKKAEVNWCPSCMTVLADEQVITGECERCASKVIKKDLEQWFFKITDYADRLLKNLETIDWPEPIKIAQKNWIGKSEGAEIDFELRVQEKPNFVLLHGYKGSAKRNFIPWLKVELEKRGYVVDAPELPNTNNPKEKEQVDYVLSNTSINENTIIVGHSLGAIVGMKVLERLNRKIKGLVTVGAATLESFGGQKRPWWKDFSSDANFGKIIKMADFRIILSDLEEDNREFRISYQEKLAEKLSGRLIEAVGESKHFCAKVEPAIYNALLPRIKVFTTRPDTLFGATYVVLGPEHPLLRTNGLRIINYKEVEEYIKKAKAKANEDRIATGKEKTGIELKGIKAINPAHGKEIPVWVADYVLGNVGTGAIMAVPAHDERDFQFAKKFNLPIKKVVAGEFGQKKPNEEFRNGGAGIVFDPGSQKYAVARWNDDGRVSLFAGGLNGKESVREAIIREVKEEGGFYDFERVEWIDVAYAHFFNKAKNVNRFARAECLLLILKSVKQNSIALEDHENFEVVWLSADEILTEWEKRNKDGGYSHYMEFLREGVARAIELGYDKVSNRVKYIAKPFVGRGFLENSEKFDGVDSETVRWEITKFVGGERKVQYRLRDWLISRQRYWGPPIPMINCEKCGWQVVPEKDLPVKLPHIKDFRPKGTGESPLAGEEKFYKVRCPKCKSWARRETDVSDTFLDSAWYYLGYLMVSGKWKMKFGDSKFRSLLKKWTPADMYIGGAEHAVLHLLYVRFVAMALHDWKFVQFDEPFKKFRTHGLITKDGTKMSKSGGNVVNPDEYINAYGADAMRMYLAFLAPLPQGGDFRDEGIRGITRFLERVWKFANEKRKTKNEKPQLKTPNDLDKQVHKIIKKVTEDIENFQYNTAISALMILLNQLEEKFEEISEENFNIFLKLLSPFAPYIAEELWQKHFAKSKEFSSVHKESWPKFDPKLIVEEIFELVIQINGKVRGKVTLSVGVSAEAAKKAALGIAQIHEQAQNPRKIIFVSNKLINFVV